MYLHGLPILPPNGGRMGRLCRYIEVEFFILFYKIIEDRFDSISV